MDKKGTQGAKLISLTEAADLLAVSPRTIRRRISDGQLPGYRIGNHPHAPVRVKESDVLALSEAMPHEKND